MFSALNCTQIPTLPTSILSSSAAFKLKHPEILSFGKGLCPTGIKYEIKPTAIAIRCYVCNSYFQQDCGDWFDNRTFNLEKCDPEVTMCRKVVQEVYYNDEWNVRYIRQCAPSGEVGGDEGRQCMERTGTYRVKMRYCQCDNQDGCNGATSVNIPFVTMIVPALTTLGLLFRKL